MRTEAVASCHLVLKNHLVIGDNLGKVYVLEHAGPDASPVHALEMDRSA